MKISIGCDHVAIELKNYIIEHLKKKNYEVIDVGTFNPERTDYPIYARTVCENIQTKKSDKGILVCGTGVGMSIAANKFRGIRAVVCSDTFSARASVEHNNTNILCIGARVVGSELALEIVDAWLNATYQGERHQKRIDLITEYETLNKC